MSHEPLSGERLELPSPLDFALGALEAEGALVERHEREGRAVALLPHALSRALKLPEECQLAVHESVKGDVGVGLGTPLLEALVSAARARSPFASVRLGIDPPRPAHVRALVGRFVLRNGLSELAHVSMGNATYVAAWLAYVAEADDRREGVIPLVIGPEGGEPDEAVRASIDFRWPPDRAQPAAVSIAAREVASWLRRRGERLLRDAVAPLEGDVARRHARDYERITSYFTALVTEARAPRRKTEPKAIEAKVAHLLAERDKKLRDLGQRYAMRVSVKPAALVAVELPVALVSVRLRRRKAERTITLRVPSGAHEVDKLACEACAAATGKPAACDDTMHLLCERCAPGVQGRIACPACERRAG